MRGWSSARYHTDADAPRHRLALFVDEPAGHGGRMPHADRDRFGRVGPDRRLDMQPPVGAECRQSAPAFRVEPEHLGLVAIEYHLMRRRRRQPEDDRPAHWAAIGVDEADPAGQARSGS